MGKKGQWGALSVIKLKNKIIYRREALIVIQKSVRMHLARKRHAPRYKGVLRLKKLQNQIEEIGVMGGKLKGGKESIKSNVDKIYTQLDAAIAKIKASERISSREIEMMHSSLVAAIQKEIAGVKKKIETEKIAEEQARLRKIQEEMELERKKKEEEERKKAEVEAERRIK